MYVVIAERVGAVELPAAGAGPPRWSYEFTPQVALVVTGAFWRPMRESQPSLTCEHVLDRISAVHEPLFWLHPPKCGTSFGASVDAYRISAARSHQLHQSLPSPLEPGAVGFFREPRERLLSAYDYIVG